MIPANTTATVTLAKATADNILLNNGKMKSEVLKTLKQTEEGVQLELGSGTYQFSYPAGNLKP